MKLDNTTIDTLDNLLQTCNILGFTRFIILPNKIGACDEKRVVGMIVNGSFDYFEGRSLGVNRVKVLKDRLALAKSLGAINLESTDSATNGDISMLQISSGRSKSQFRCAATELIKVPKGLVSTDAYSFMIPFDLIPAISQAESSMASEKMVIASKNGKDVSIELVDSTKDVYTFDLDRPASCLKTDGPPMSFCYGYTAKTLLPVLKEAAKAGSSHVEVTLGHKGMLFVSVNGYSIYNVAKS